MLKLNNIIEIHSPQVNSSESDYDEDDFISFQFENHEINIYFSNLIKYSRFIRKNYVYSNVKNKLPQDLQNFQVQYDINSDNIFYFFQLFQKKFNITENVILTYKQYIDLFKISEFLQIKKFTKKLIDYSNSHSADIDFIIQIILYETENSKYSNNNQFQIDQNMEDILSSKINECIQKDKFSAIPIDIIYRILEKCDLKNIVHDLLYDFIKKDLKKMCVLFGFLDIEKLSDEKANNLFDYYTNTCQTQQKYFNYLKCNIGYILKLRKSNNDLQIEMKQRLNEIEQEKNRIEQEKVQIQNRLNQLEKQKNQQNQQKSKKNRQKNQQNQKANQPQQKNQHQQQKNQPEQQKSQQKQYKSQKIRDICMQIEGKNQPEQVKTQQISTIFLPEQRKNIIKIAINGFGRIGRLAFRAIRKRYPNECQVVAIHDQCDIKTNVHLLNYDTAHGRSLERAKIISEDRFEIGEGSTKWSVYSLSQKLSPSELPWKELDIDVVLESTGIYRKRAIQEGDKIIVDGYNGHIFGGAKKVVLASPADDKIECDVVLGVNDEVIKPNIQLISNESSAINCIAPIIKILNDKFGILTGFVTSVESYSNNQEVQDFGNIDLRLSRNFADNIIPTNLNNLNNLPDIVHGILRGKINGISIKVSTIVGSLVDFCINVRDSVTKEQVNEALKNACESHQLKDIMRFTLEPIVSSDVIDDPHSSIIDGLSTKIIKNHKGCFVKILAWYDNEWMYSCRCADIIHRLKKYL